MGRNRNTLQLSGVIEIICGRKPEAARILEQACILTPNSPPLTCLPLSSGEPPLLIASGDTLPLFCPPLSASEFSLPTSYPGTWSVSAPIALCFFLLVYLGSNPLRRQWVQEHPRVACLWVTPQPQLIGPTWLIPTHTGVT